MTLARPGAAAAAAAVSALLHMVLGTAVWVALAGGAEPLVHPLLPPLAFTAGPIAGAIARRAGAPSLLFPMIAGAALGALASWPGVAAGAICGLGDSLVAPRLERRFAQLAPMPRIWRHLAMAATLLAALQLWRASAFLIEPDFTAGASVPTVRPRHLCLAAYLRAGELARAGDSAGLYDPARYAAAERTAIQGLEPYLGDPYQYPPPFLLLPAAGLALSDDAQTLRAGWFALSLWLLAAAGLAAGWRVGGPALVLSGFALVSPPSLASLQMGQAHMLAIAAGVAAAIAFHERRDLGGGALLAAATLAKLFPAVLGLPLLLGRRWRAACATAAAAALLVALQAGWLGLAPIEAFVDRQLPDLLSGKAFAAFAEDRDFVIANLSTGSLVDKLALVTGGEPAAPGAGAGVAARLLTLATLALAAWASLSVWRARDAGGAAIASLATLVLASCVAGYAPAGYAMAAPLWLLALDLGRHPPATPLPALAWAAGFGFLSIVPFASGLPGVWRMTPLLATMGIAAQVGVIAVSVLAARRAHR